MNLIDSLDHNELALLKQRWGNTPSEEHLLSVDHPFLTGINQKITKNLRRAEICYVMHRGEPTEGILLHTKTYYPENAYRLPTGGINQGEAVEETLAREIFEETGMRVGNGADHVVVQRYLGHVAYEFEHPQMDDRSTFATYHFLVQMPKDGELVPQDEEEEISGWEWCAVARLADVAERLASIRKQDDEWADWGRFRALSHRFVLAQLGE